MTRSGKYRITPLHITDEQLCWRSCGAIVLGERWILTQLRKVCSSAAMKTVTLPMFEAPSNFGVKLTRPGAGPAAELPTSSPA